MAIAIEKAGEEDFRAKVLNRDEPVLVDFWAQWCGPCHALAPELEELARIEKGFRIVKVSVEESPAAAERFGIRAIPTLVLFLKGHEVSRLTGIHHAQDLKAWVRNQLSRTGD